MATKSKTASKTASKSAKGTTLRIAEVKEPKAAKATPETTAAPKAPKAEKVAKTPKAAAGPAIEIITALYGVEGTRVSMATVKPGRKLTNKMAGSDPAPKVAKDAIITAKVDGTEVTVTVKEGEVIAFA